MTDTKLSTSAVDNTAVALKVAHSAKETAADHAEDLRDRLRTGDTTVTTKMLVDPDAATERTPLLHGASVNAHAKAVRLQTPPSDLATALVDALAKVLR